MQIEPLLNTKIVYLLPNSNSLLLYNVSTGKKVIDTIASLPYVPSRRSGAAYIFLSLNNLFMCGEMTKAGVKKNTWVYNILSH